MFFLLTLIFCAIPLFILYVHLKWAKEDIKLGINGPPCIPILGNLILFWKHIKNETTHDLLFDLINQYGDTIRVRIGPKLLIFTIDVKIIEAIVNNAKFIKSDDYKIYEQWLGDGLVLTSGEKWHKMRKLLTPAFHFQILERFIQIFQEQGKVFLDKIQNIPEEEVIDVVPWYHSFALDVISESSMGVKLKAQSDPRSKFVVANKELLDILCLRFYNPLYSIDWIWKLTRHYRKVCERVNYIHDFVNDVINKRRDTLISISSEDKNNEKPALLDILLQSTIDGEPLSNAMIRDEINTFMLAGHETTGTTLGFITFLLAKHAEVQQKVYNEIKENGLNVTDKNFSIRDINSLAYFDCVIKEVLRLYPILPDTFKQCKEDFRFGEKIFLPANTAICTCIHSSHLHPKNFVNPHVFNPDRFIDEVTAKERNPYIYQPFSSGLRNCIGQKFALLEMKTLLIQILSKYKIKLCSDDFEVDVRNTTLLFSRNGVKIKFIKQVFDK